MLAPFQQKAYDQLTQLLAHTYLIDFYGSPGSGKTTILKELRKQVPGWLLHAHDIVDFFEKQEDSHSREIWFYRQVKSLLDTNSVVYIDNFDLVHRACAVPPGAWDLVRKALANTVLAAGKHIVFVGASGDELRSTTVIMPPMSTQDRADLLNAVLQQLAAVAGGPLEVQGDLSQALDALPNLNGHQLRRLAAIAVRRRAPVTPELVSQLLAEIGADQVPSA